MDIQISLHPSDGPRDFYSHHNKSWLNSIQEERSTIVLFDYDSKVGTLTSRQTISTLSSDFVRSNFVSADCRFVYAGNRLHDSIGILSIGSKGKRCFIAEEWTREIYSCSFSFYSMGIINELSP